ncbi:MAG TPA: cytochrome b [Burkholderiales bacterium]
MSWNNTKSGYGSPAIMFHWVMAVLIVAVYAAMDLKSFSQKGSALREAMASWHYVLGLSVFVLVWLRLLVRLTGVTPAIEPAPPAWQATLAKVVYRALYVFMIVMPLLGWLTLSAKGAPVPFFGLELPALTGKDEGLAILFKAIHENLATVGYFLIGLHAAAALFHHYVRRDNTLRLMWRRR